MTAWEWYKYFWHSMTPSYSEKLLFDDFTNVLWPQWALDGSVPFYKHLYKNKKKTNTVTNTSSHVKHTGFFSIHHKKKFSFVLSAASKLFGDNQLITGCISSCWITTNMGQGWTGRDTLGQRRTCITTQTGFDIIYMSKYFNCLETTWTAHYYTFILHTVFVSGSHCRTILRMELKLKWTFYWCLLQKAYDVHHGIECICCE